MEGGDGSDVPTATPAGEAEMDVPKKDATQLPPSKPTDVISVLGVLPDTIWATLANMYPDVRLLADEKFDFDLSLSSLSANEDDEVFFGPVGHKERCIATSLELNNRIPEEPPLLTSAREFRWSPLTGEKFVEVYKEAHLLALQIESSGKSKAAPAAQPEDPWSQGVERFIQESKLKLSLFEKASEVQKSPKSLKRETYYLSDSPLAPLLSGPQSPMGVGLQGAPAQAGLTQAQRPPCSALPAEPSSVHLPSPAVTQRKAVSRLLPPRASSVRGRSARSASEQQMREKPASPPRVNIHGAVPPDRPSTARDATGLPASGSHLVHGKRSLPVPNKLGLKKTLLKPPGCAGALARRSSSRGPASPAAGRAEPGERAGAPTGGSQPRSNPSRPGRSAPAGPRPALQAGPTAVSAQSRDAGPAERTAARPPAPSSSALPQPQTPEQRGPRPNSHPSLSRSSRLNGAGSTGRRDSHAESRTKATPAPTSHLKIPRFAAGEPPDSSTPNVPRAQRPQSCTSVGRVAVHSTPARRSSGPAAHGLPSAARTSALPTPAGRRLSALPLLTPKTVPRALAAPLCVSAQQLATEPRKSSAVRAAARCVDASSDGSFSPPAAVPRALNFSPEKTDFTLSKSVTTEVALEEAQPPADASPREAVLVDLTLDRLTITPKAGGTPLVDLPLIDFGSTPEAHVAGGAESRPLIDLLLNTPDADGSAAAKPPHELIDLCSPLIQLSPEADKENVDSLLLRF